MTSFIKNHPILLLICSVFSLVGLARLNDLSLYTDSTRYLIWGDSVAHFKGFVDETQPEPEHFVVNAPLLAVIVAPVEIFFPLSVYAAKTWTLLWGAVALILFFFWLRRRFGKTTSLVATAFLAFNPLVVVISSEILSEAPFFAFLFASFIYLDQLTDGAQISKKGMTSLIAVLVSVTLLREIGAALVIAAVLVLLTRNKIRLALVAVLGAIAFFGLWTLRNAVWVEVPITSQSGNLQFIFQHFVTPGDASLISELTARFWLNLKSYLFPLASSLLYPFPSTLIVTPSETFLTVSKILGSGEIVIVVVSTLFVLTGIILDVRSSSSAPTRLIFLSLYLGIILFYPVQDIRFLLPVLPFSLFYILCTSVWLAHLFQLTATPLKRNLAVSFVLVLFIPNILALTELVRTNLAYLFVSESFFREAEASNARAGYFLRPWSKLGDWMRENLADDIIMASPAKEIVPFIGDRKVLELNRPVPLPLFEQNLRDYQVEFVLAPTTWDSLRAYQFVMRESQRFQFDLIHRVGDLNLFSVRSTLKEPSKNPRFEHLGFDTTRASSLLMLGRLYLISERYADAVRVLERARELAPGQAEVTYQLLNALAMSGNDARAIQLASVLFSQPQSTSYMPSIRMQLHAMALMSQASRSRDVQHRSLLIYDAATAYWALGFRDRAYSVLKAALEKDQSYFVGLLWGWHYAVQLKDTAQARIYLGRLERIDRENRVVRHFHIISALADTLRKSSDSTRRSELHLAIARSYDEIELPEEALDEAERSIGEDPKSIEAWLYYGSLFERRNKQRAALKAYRRVLSLDLQNATAAERLAALQG